MGRAPTILAAGLAAAAVFSLGLTLVASVHRRQRDLALLEGLGFSRRQIKRTIAWQSTATVAVAAIPGRIAAEVSTVDLLRSE